MRGNQHGIVLMNTLMMLALLSLLIISQMQLISLQFKSVNHFLYRHQIFQELERQTNRLLMSGLEEGWSPDCVIQETNTDVLIKRLKKDEGCLVTNKKQRYHFFVEDMGFFPCMTVMFNGVSYGTRHFRLTITSATPMTMTLQLRIATRAECGMCSERESVQIKAGIISWRHIS